MVVARMEVNFGKVLSPIEFIQKVIYDENGKCVLDGKHGGFTLLTNILSLSFIKGGF
jgi:hypothetical protein